MDTKSCQKEDAGQLSQGWNNNIILVFVLTDTQEERGEVLENKVKISKTWIGRVHRHEACD